ncbi:hypothetical protein AB833_06610 [Chromatiales bacterium (ex Bugula neritina AB1)]|nr:hypothetical protein AB833_06610 [Chromatiales bacterium (ex Bugula neritina AB1)]
MLSGVAASILVLALMTGNAVALVMPDFETLVKKHGKAVVKISVSTKQKLASAGPEGREINPEQIPEFFRRYFENIPRGRAPEALPPGSRRSSGSGSGFIVSQDGYIVTNAHVVDGASEITVALPDRRQFDAFLVGSDPRTDLALLKVKASGLPVLELGDSGELNVGQWVLAIGSPFGFEYTATQGIVSALSRSLPDENYVPFIQTDVAVNPGNSGGPLFNIQGEVIGVNSQIFSRSGGYMGLSFAIPSNVVKTVVKQLKETGYVQRGWLGVVIQNVDKSLAESFGLDRPEGALVARVTENSPAQKAGFKTGDVILSFNGQSIEQSSHLPPLVGVTPVGQPVVVEVLRDRAKVALEVTIAELAEDREIVKTRVLERNDESRLGVSVAGLTQEQRAEAGGIDGGVVVTSVDPSGVAALAGISVGDVILMFNQVPIDSAEALAELVDQVAPGESVAVLVQRNDNPLYTALTLK